MSFVFRGRKVLVTGAGRGIGRGVAAALSRSGCKVYALSRTKPSLDTLVEECQSITPIVADVSDWENTREKLEELEPLDGLVNNAGVDALGTPSVDCTKDSIRKTLDNNLLSAINCTQVMAKKMMGANIKGSIVNVSSIGGISAFPGAMPYTVSKAGMDMVTKQFALELGPHGIRVNSVNPNVVLTPMISRLIDSKEFNPDFLISRTPIGRVMDMKECVDPILYLLSDHSTMVTGHLHIIDGGLLSNIVNEK